jgi:integrase
MAQARQRGIRGVEAATLFRNGILLSIAVALPQRARALSCLAFDQSLWLMPEGRLRFLIPGDRLKLPEAEKSTSPFELAFRSIRLAEALQEYRTAFRPIFDDGKWVFPNTKAPGAGIGERHLGRIVGNITEEALGVRVSVHRIRDNVATEASEIHSAGATAASLLLGHRDLRTTQRYYDHSTGLAVATDFATHLDRLRSGNILLDV